MTCPVASSLLIHDSIVGLSDIDDLAAKISTDLLASHPFGLHLRGPMGAGKSTWVRALLRCFGQDPRIPVQSPTYTYAHTYDLAMGSFLHFDFYRHHDSATSLAEVAVATGKEYRGFFYEWGDALTPQPPLVVTHVLALDYADPQGQRRRISFGRTDTG